MGLVPDLRINPSILSADFVNMQADLERISNADFVHVDVMDNHFVPNLSMGAPTVEALVARATLPVDAHLMIEEADRWAPVFADLGCHSVSFHAEATAAPVRLAREIHRLGARSCLALRPATDIAPYVDLLPEFDMILIMTVEPGFGGQSFLDSALPKIRRARSLVGDADIWVQVDGGVGLDTIERCADAGANVFVAGSAVYSADDPAAACKALRDLAAPMRVAEDATADAS